MLICPLCGANAIKEQPEPSLHAFTTIFECGTKIDQAFNASDWTYAQKCNEPIRKNPLDLLLNPDTLIPIYANQKIPTYVTKSIFLIGSPYYPNRNIDSWRTKALNYLKNKDFKGYVFIPEIEKLGQQLPAPTVVRQQHVSMEFSKTTPKTVEPAAWVQERKQQRIDMNIKQNKPVFSDFIRAPRISHVLASQ